jgi:hypothetical protein
VALGDVIQTFFSEKGLGSRSRNRVVFNAWSEAIGDQAAQPVAFRRGDLVVEVNSSALLQELKSFTGDRFRRRANEILGVDRIRRIVVKLKS